MATNSEIRRLFLQVAVAQNLSEGTVYRYRRWIRKLLEFHVGIALDQVDGQDIAEFYKTLEAFSPSTQNQARNAIDFLFSKVLRRQPQAVSPDFLIEKKVLTKKQKLWLWLRRIWGN